MVSPHEASVDLRENFPPSRNILHSRKVVAPTDTGRRTSLKVPPFPIDYRGWLVARTSQKVSTGHLTYPVDVRDTAESGMGHTGNRHLRYFVEFISGNVGGFYPDTKTSSLSMPDRSVGGAIVVGAWESHVQGEGHQGINAL
jgi:hypothetical protein